jgi:putative ABC transport system substrate-binding protein
MAGAYGNRFRVVVAGAVAEAQQPKKVARIVYLGRGSPQNTGPKPGSGLWVRLEGLRQGLRELGYEEGRNIIIEYRVAAGKRDRIPAIVAELVQLKTDVIIWAAGDDHVRQVKRFPLFTLVPAIS